MHGAPCRPHFGRTPSLKGLRGSSSMRKGCLHIIMSEKYNLRFHRIKILFYIASAAIPLGIGAVLLDSASGIGSVLQIAAILFLVPFVIYTYCISILHWKDRYRGPYSDLWGILLIIETSGWFKLIYFFRHMLPDAKGTGRYKK